MNSLQNMTSNLILIQNYANLMPSNKKIEETVLEKRKIVGKISNYKERRMVIYGKNEIEVKVDNALINLTPKNQNFRPAWNPSVDTRQKHPRYCLLPVLYSQIFRVENPSVGPL